jgi:hypothetical protein
MFPPALHVSRADQASARLLCGCDAGASYRHWEVHDASAYCSCAGGSGGREQPGEPAGRGRRADSRYVANSGSVSVTPFDASLGRPGQPIAVQSSPVLLFQQGQQADPDHSGAASLAVKPNRPRTW